MLLAAPAHAGVAGSDPGRYLPVAVAYWGTTPCPSGRVALAWGHPGAGYNAWSNWLATSSHADPATFEDCKITFSLDVDWTEAKLCTITIHEVGHLLGHDHIADRSDVMYPFYVGPVSQCAGLDPPPTPVTKPAHAYRPLKLKRRGPYHLTQAGFRRRAGRWSV